MGKTKSEQEADLFEWFIHLAEHDWAMTIRLLRLRQMIEHRGLSLKDLSKEIGTSREWLSLILLGKAYYEPGDSDSWNKQDKALNMLEKIEDGITSLTDKKIGGIGFCCSDSRSDMIEILAPGPATREQFYGEWREHDSQI